MVTRATWKGAISFGLVTIPVALHKATETKGVAFNQLHADCGARVRQKRVCENGHEVAVADIVKGFALDKTTYVTMTEDDFDGLPLASAHVIEVQRFVDASELDPLSFQGGYYLSPDTAGDRGYALITKAMEAEKKVGIGRIAFREREHLAVIRSVSEATGSYLVLSTLFWPDEVRPAAYVGSEKVNKNELDMARMLITNLSGPWVPSEYHDAYREALMERIEAKAQGIEPEKAAKVATPHAADLTATLKASIAAIGKKKPAAKTAAKRKTA